MVLNKNIVLDIKLWAGTVKRRIDIIQFCLTLSPKSTLGLRKNLPINSIGGNTNGKEYVISPEYFLRTLRDEH